MGAIPHPMALGRGCAQRGIFHVETRKRKRRPSPLPDQNGAVDSSTGRYGRISVSWLSRSLAAGIASLRGLQTPRASAHAFTTHNVGGTPSRVLAARMRAHTSPGNLTFILMDLGMVSFRYPSGRIVVSSKRRNLAPSQFNVASLFHASVKRWSLSSAVEGRAVGARRTL